jgi:hypothetical protein
MSEMGAWELRPGSFHDFRRQISVHRTASAGHRRRSAITTGGGQSPVFSLLSLFFALFPIALAPAAFLSSAQGLALQMALIFHCRSIVFCFVGAQVHVLHR